jgi:hypothetical protein
MKQLPTRYLKQRMQKIFGNNFITGEYFGQKYFFFYDPDGNVLEACEVIV